MAWWRRVSGSKSDAPPAMEVRLQAPPVLDAQVLDADTKYAGMGQGARASAMRRDGRPLSALDSCYANEHDAEFVRGKHFLHWAEDLKALKRQDRWDEALTLVLEIIDATERGQAAEARNAAIRAEYFHGAADEFQPRETPPGWTEQAAIILRKLGRIEEEIAVIDRWVAHAGAPGRWVGQTHAKLIERRAKAETLLANQRG